MTNQTRFGQTKSKCFVALLALILTLATLTACGAEDTEAGRTTTTSSSNTETVVEGGTPADHTEITTVIQKSVDAMARMDGRSFDAMQCRAYRPAPGSPDSFSGILDSNVQKDVRLVRINRISVTGNSASASYTLKYKTLDDESSVDGHFVREDGTWLSC